MKANIQKRMVCLPVVLAGFMTLVPGPAGAQQSSSTASAPQSTPQVQSASAHSGKTSRAAGLRPSLSPHHRKHSRGTRHRSSRSRRKKATSASSQGQ
jgi:hypothetical protein